MDNNKYSWDKYSLEYSQNSTFDPNLLHLGLGMKGISPECISTNSQGNFLDIGCGDGVNTNILANYSAGKVIGIDVAESAIDIASQRYCKSNLLFLNNDIFTFKSNNLLFDVITFFGSLDYIKIDDEFFKHLNKLSKINGVCFISKFHPLWTTLFNNEVDEIKMDSYFENGRIDKVIYGNEKELVFERYHYNIEYLIGEFKKNSWILEYIHEPLPSIDESAFSYTNYMLDEVLMERMKKIPMTIILKFTYKGGR
ncbi:class I SAM-dependent methyltransferase [Dehalobacter sp. 14DCB1]|uniref:class I SAM-dependent methyltransferase n=1 Tax=Dehalobacter sp. 14DCB1 TaxID=2070227 RepID=UPI001046AD83|nr:class I SAM-dependent methyltransferase [Dehalobacter sp. 14DCB1]TCX53565.1 hypothetical protein C1I36_02155 [Dehalobacter sp. 14DCB1]